MKILALPMLLGIIATPALAADHAADQLARGAYLGAIMDCAGCHMPRGPDGAPVAGATLSGGTVGFEIPGMGIFWPPNLTPDASGLGDWTDAEIAAAIIGGISRDGHKLAPIMPATSYAALTPEDLQALITWLRSLPATPTERLVPVTDAAKAKAPFYRVTLPQQ